MVTVSPPPLRQGGTLGKRNVLLVVVHLDDESMFFSPTLSYLTSRGHNPQILCLSIGDANGKGEIRKEVFYHACAILKVVEVPNVSWHDIGGLENVKREI